MENVRFSRIGAEGIYLRQLTVGRGVRGRNGGGGGGGGVEGS